MIKKIYSFNFRHLTGMRREYLTKLKNWRNSQMPILRQSKILTDYDQEKWLNLIKRDRKQKIFAILESINNNKKNNFIGYCGITCIDYRNKRGEISFLVNTERIKNKSLYKQDFLSALYMLCLHAFETMRLHKLHTETYVFRQFHISILEEFGLKPSGVLREQKFLNGKFYDSIIHSVLRKEWPKLKKRVENVLEK